MLSGKKVDILFIWKTVNKAQINPSQNPIFILFHYFIGILLFSLYLEAGIFKQEAWESLKTIRVF